MALFRTKENEENCKSVMNRGVKSGRVCQSLDCGKERTAHDFVLARLNNKDCHGQVNCYAGQFTHFTTFL